MPMLGEPRSNSTVDSELHAAKERLRMIDMERHIVREQVRLGVSLEMHAC